ncbi:coiled-coil domain-containing protein [Neobacillus vireti]|uniref:Secreted cell wall DL-endopeptidase n=1 Tax=Neobacillus vireti LMG 21834 TaxID=1131730 RepID=A0AB94IFZ4_9BACI|nr:C40 family peptidase [Neobacillus vireti]ETI66032.1 secreted cell wall DL-endopeptidase [Neobacillus vireti LMG 21834]KLT19316.1 peptidase [Neobacillus vireti]
MKRKLTALSSTIILGISSAFSFPAIKAEATSIKSVQEQRLGIQSEISIANQEISQVQNELAKIIEQINRVEQAINDNNNMIVQTEEKVKASQEEVAGLQQEVTKIKERIDKRNEILKKRALAIQERGGNVSYIDVLIGASSFSDFVDRLGAVAAMVEADQDLVKQHQEDQQTVEQKQTRVEKKLENLNELKTELEGMQSQILEQKQQNEALKEELMSKEQEKISNKTDLQQQDSTLALKEAELITEAHISDGSNIADLNVSTPTTANEAINIVIHAGDRYIGNSVYVFGGGRNAYDVANGRFDCSGFVAWAFAQAGIKVGAHTDILKNTGTRVTMNEARPGDLVFFDTYKIDGHVGIYLGGGKFIGSQSSTGIAIADMTSRYYSEHFNGRVMRIINDKEN